MAKVRWNKCPLCGHKWRNALPMALQAELRLRHLDLEHGLVRKSHLAGWIALDGYRARAMDMLDHLRDEQNLMACVMLQSAGHKL